MVAGSNSSTNSRGSNNNNITLVIMAILAIGQTNSTTTTTTASITTTELVTNIIIKFLDRVCFVGVQLVVGIISKNFSAVLLCNRLDPSSVRVCMNIVFGKGWGGRGRV